MVAASSQLEQKEVGAVVELVLAVGLTYHFPVVDHNLIHASHVDSEDRTVLLAQLGVHFVRRLRCQPRRVADERQAPRA